MQVNGSRALTFLDFIKGLDPKGKFLHRVIDLAVRQNEMLDDICVVEANNGTALETTFRTEVPKPVWTQYYGGIPSNKSSKAKLKVSCGTMGQKILVAKKLFDDAKDKDAVLWDEIQSCQEGMRMEMGDMLVYGNIADNPLGFNGLMKHYDKIGSEQVDDDRSEHYVFDAFGIAGGASAASESKLGSVLLAGWSPNTITCFHPEGSQTGGIEISERRTADVHDPDKGGDATYEAYLQYLYWTLGIAVRDFRYGGRIANIQRDDMLNHANGEEPKVAAQRYIELLDRLSTRVRDGGGVKQAWYMDKLMWEKVRTLFSRVTRDNAITFVQVEGRKEKRLFDIPVRIQDCMKVNEAKVATVA